MSWYRLASAVLLLVLISALPARAQTAESDEDGAKGRVKKILDVFDGPVHPIFKSVAPGGGFGPGVGYRAGRKDGPWSFRTEALVTMHKYWNVDASLQYPRGWIQGELYARARDMKRLDFYGLGTGTAAADRTSFGLMERTTGAIVVVRPLDFEMLEFGARLDRIWPDVRRGWNAEFASIEERFSESQAPGLTAQPGFLSHSEFIGLMWPAGTNSARPGAHVRLTRRAFNDNGDGRFDFSRVEVEAQQRIPGIRPRQRLTLHQYFSTANVEPGREVPFYLQQTLGGTSTVRFFHESLLGSDGTAATLRGFRNLRFRGPHLLLMQAEYRFPVKGPVEATVFADAGNVGMTRSALSLGDLKKDVGFSLSYVKDDAALARIDIAGGGGEGLRVFINFGGLLQR
jgi:hypothetical protein